MRERAADRYYPAVTKLRKPYQFVLILSHMRSGSSLLVHLLASNPDVCGYGESHIRYQSVDDWSRLTARVLYTLNRFPYPGTERYILDKCLHDYLLFPESAWLLNSDRVRVVFLLREPAGTLSSLMSHVEDRSSEARALDYYSSRLRSLQAFSETLCNHERCVMITYDQLLSRTGDTFRLLERFLGLSEAMSERYDLLSTTGIRHIGDTSPNIHSGRILQARSQTAADEITPSVLKEAERSYAQCHQTLSRHCLTLTDEVDEATGR